MIGGISFTKILILFALVVVLFGTKKLRGLGADLGASIRGFKKAMIDDDIQPKNKDAEISSADADFALKSSEIKLEMKAEDTNSQKKGQV